MNATVSRVREPESGVSILSTRRRGFKKDDGA